MRDDGTVVYESPASADNPLLVTLPANLPDGTYRLRTRSTKPNTTGAPGEPFTVRQSVAPTSPPQKLLRVPVTGGTADATLLRVGYRYEPDSHGFFVMVRANVPMDVRMERIDGGPFGDSDWRPALSSSQFPDYDEFAGFYYLRNYPPYVVWRGGRGIGGAVSASVRRQGDAGAGVWFDAELLAGRVILYELMETVAAIPPVVTITSPAMSTCVGSSEQSFPVAFEVTDGSPRARAMCSASACRMPAVHSSTKPSSATVRPVPFRLRYPLRYPSEPATGFGWWPATRP